MLQDNQNISFAILNKLKQSSTKFVIETHEPVVTCQDVVRFLNVPLESIVKCIAFRSKLDHICVAAIPGNRRVSVKKLEKVTGHHHLKMIPAAEVTNVLGIPLGAISPLSLPCGAILVIDRSLSDLEKIFMGTGDPCSSLILNGRDLLNNTTGSIADITE